jgi:hypothetical protein
MSLVHEFGVGHANEMGTETWRIQTVQRMEHTMTFKDDPDQLTAEVTEEQIILARKYIMRNVPLEHQLDVFDALGLVMFA